MKQFYLFLKLFLLLSVHAATAQVLNPNDPIVVYNSSAPPTEPTWGQIGKWVKTTRLNWNTSSYKCYIYKGMQFRLKWPANYNPAKKYPIFVFFHGLGERGTKYDNEYSMFHGGQAHMNAVDQGKFDGFLLYPQNQTGYFGQSYYDAIEELINNFFRPQLNVDPYRVIVDGLSAGGSATWDFMRNKSKMVAGLLPISAATSDLINTVNTWKYTPIWWFQGGVDPNPPPAVAQSIYDQAIAVGANVKLRIYPGQGHGVWGQAWAEADYFPFLSRVHKANPWPLFGRTEFCPGDPVNITLGLTPGFNQYEWRKDGAVIPGATGNTLNVTTYGTYDARIYNGTVWSDWSPAPIVVKVKAPTVSPNIAIAGLMSNVLPTPAGADSVTLQVPTGYTSYLWKKTTEAPTLGTTNQLTVRQTGEFVVRVTEQFGCSSEFSAPFKVIPANGANGPDALLGLSASAISRTQITLNWSDKASPTFNETLFEVYRSTNAATGYALVGKVNADIKTFTDNGLAPATTYYYKVRPVNDNGAATVGAAVNATTQADVTAPSIPANLVVSGVSRNSAALTWSASTDDVGVDKYEIYVNGLKSYTINGDQTSFTVGGLAYQQVYTFTVKAKDAAGNLSNASNQVSATTVASGLNYKYYQGTWSTLPNFATLTPVKTGNTPTADISVRNQNDNFGFLWEGYINIPVAGNYTFETYSDDGSKLYIGTYSHTATALVNNDGAHGAQYREGTINLSKGVHPIAITFFEAGGGETMQVYWKNTASGVGSRQLIPASAFVETFTPPGTAPAAPSAITVQGATHDKLDITWTDNATTETGFEIYRSNTYAGPYSIVKTVGANVTSLRDSVLNPLTTYYYRVQAINQYGSSGYALTEYDGLKYDYYEATLYTQLPNFPALTPKKSGNIANVDITPRDRNTQFAMKFEGWVYIPTAGSWTFFTTSDAGSKLYIDGFTDNELVVSNDHLTGSVEKSGTKTLTAGYHRIIVTYFENSGSRALQARYQGPGVAKQLIPNSALQNPYIKGTTLAIPPAPAAPSNLAGSAIATDTIGLTWNDNSTSETGTEIHRSMGVNTAYTLLKTLGANAGATGSFRDSSVAAHTTYFYKLRAKNAGGPSAFSNEISVTSANNAPVMEALTDKHMRFGTQIQVDITATDADGDAITLTATNLPAFAAFADNGNGTGRITFNPALSDLGTFANITVTAADAFTGSAARSFTLVVDDNYQPVVSPISNVTLAEKGTQNFSLTATDQNATDVLTWELTGLPAFATFTPNGNTADIALAPGYTDNGVYNVTAKITDGRGGEDVKSFTITITDVDPNYKVSINFTEGSWQAAAPWYNTNKKPVLGDIFTGIKDHLGRNTPITMTIMTPWQNINGGANTNNQGYNPGNNAGIYPDAVMVSSWWTQTVKQTIKLSGFDPNYRYDFTMFGSRNGISDARIALYRINDTATVTNNATNNQGVTSAINNIRPNAAGEIMFDLDVAPGSVYAYINSMVISASFDDGNPPAKAGALNARIINEGIRLNWTDRAFNESSYTIHRATAQAGPYALISTRPANDTAFTDETITGSTTYFYYVASVNTYGTNNSDTVSISVPNRAPNLAAIANVNMKTDSVAVINLTATDDPADIITFSATGLPTFATLQPLSNGSAKITLSPTDGNTGTFNVTVTAKDNNNLQSSRTFTIQVTDKNLTSVYVDFNRIDPSSSPWNNFNAAPFAGANIANLNDASGAPTGISITLLDAMTGDNTNGAVTGNNSGVFPDAVMRTYYYDQSNTDRRIRISGLSAAPRKYNLVFHGGRELVADNRNTTYGAGGQTVTLNAASNTANTVQINGLTADASGNIEFTVRQTSGSFAAYISALVIQSYVDNGVPLSPENLTTGSATTNSIKLNWTDKSSNETGFEVYRSATRTGTYSLIATTAANVTTYTNTGLAQNTLFFYKVRAKANTLFSGYSNIASGATVAYTVNINFNTVNPAPSPWNNTTALPYEGQTMANPKDNSGSPSSFSWTILENFTGTNPAGAQTGNNSGVYPDLVMAESYYVEPGDTARMQFSGLDQSKEYSFTFFASRAAGGTRIGAYSINGRTVTLDAYDNTTNTVTLDKIVPDENGELLLKVYVHTNYGYLNAMVINAFPREAAPLQARTIGSTQNANNRTTAGGSFNKASTQAADLKVSLLVDKVFPNPFISYFNMSLQMAKAGKVSLLLLDASGRAVMAKNLGDLPAGFYQQRIEVNNAVTGMYFLQIMHNGKPVQTVKLIKQ